MWVRTGLTYGLTFAIGAAVGGLGAAFLVSSHWQRNFAGWYILQVADQANVAREIYVGQAAQLAERIRASLPSYVRAVEQEFRTAGGREWALWIVSDAYRASGQLPPPEVQSVLARLPARETCRKPQASPVVGR